MEKHLKMQLIKFREEKNTTFDSQPFILFLIKCNSHQISF